MARQFTERYAIDETDPDLLYSLALTHGFESFTATRIGQIERALEAAQISWQIYDNHQFAPVPHMGQDPRIFLTIDYVIIGDTENAEHYASRMVADYSDPVDDWGLALAYYSLAITRLAQGQYEAARQNAEKSYETAVKIKAIGFLHMRSTNGETHLFALGEYDKAHELFEKSYQLRKPYRDVEGMGAALNLLASVAVIQRNYAEAEQHYLKCMELFEDIGNRGGLVRALKRIR